MKKPTLRERLRSARSIEAFEKLIEEIPYARFLGLTAGIRDDELRVLMPYGEHLVGDSSIPALHGGAVGALLESTAIFTAIWRTHAERLPKTVSLTIDYLRSGRPAETWAAAEVTKRGRRIVVVHAKAWQAEVGKPIATANVHFLLRPDRKA